MTFLSDRIGTTLRDDREKNDDVISSLKSYLERVFFCLETILTSFDVIDLSETQAGIRLIMPIILESP